MDKTDCIVVGAGVIGLAVARRLAMSGREVIALEKERAVATHTSSRNSEVIHAGIYYPPGSLKAGLCVEGKHRLYEYCAEKAVAHRRIGKLIVATREDQLDELMRLLENGRSNDVDDLRLLDAEEANRLEPAVASVAALLSPSTGIIDSHEFVISLQRDLEDAGGLVVPNSEVVGIKSLAGGFEVTTGDDYRLRCNELVNAAGLWAPQTAALVDPPGNAQIPQSYFAKGHYFNYTGRSPFTRLIYPMPNNAGLGTHATLDIGGAVRFGPDVSWVGSIDYSFDASRRDQFCEAVREYFPALDVGRLTPGYTGIRPKIAGPDQPSQDFLVQHAGHHGIAGLVNLLGMDSPGLTSSLAIAELVHNYLRR